mmetsp:Transcript_12070/g.30447  ORF Transcript_12070/g.30447 Transcript_12070/m.30447 type:complete len:106 (+) Transcript_12070:1298-1615(+)
MSRTRDLSASHGPSGCGSALSSSSKPHAAYFALVVPSILMDRLLVFPRRSSFSEPLAECLALVISTLLMDRPHVIIQVSDLLEFEEALLASMRLESFLVQFHVSS